MVASLLHTPLFEALKSHDASSTAVVNYPSGVTFSYGSLLRDVSQAKTRMLQETGRDDISSERVAFMVENGYNYVVAFLAIFALDAVAVPLAPAFPTSELRYILNDSDALVLLSSPRYEQKAKELTLEGVQRAPICHLLQDHEQGNEKDLEVELTPSRKASQGGMLLYTSGTTERPKGVLLPMTTLAAQAQSLLKAWEYTPSDRLLHVLPLHHIHGTVNALVAPLFAGSSVEFMYPFDVNMLWDRIAAPFLHTSGHGAATNSSADQAQQAVISFITAVPTVWARMLSAYPTLSLELQAAAKQAINRKNLRLNISGSAALPKPTREAWTELSGGNVLLERYGMTEVGMALSCGLHNADRVESCVGWPLPSVEARLWEQSEVTGAQGVIEFGQEVDPATGKERQGEVQLRGPTIFEKYWRNPAATASEFTPDGWFKTGDIAIRRAVPDAGEGNSGPWARGSPYFIQGRRSADIIKSGGEKISALEVERELMSLPNVSECAVVGLPSESWGQKVAAVVVLEQQNGPRAEQWGVKHMRGALRNSLVAYKIPQDLEVVLSIKRNAMGKVNKKELVTTVFGDAERIRRRSMSAQTNR